LFKARATHERVVAAIAAWRATARAHDDHGARASPADVAEAGDRCAICQVSDAYCMTTVVPARPRSRGERRSSMRTFPSLSTNANERRALDRIGLRRPRATDRRLSPIARVVTLVPIRTRSRRELHSLRTFSPGVSSAGAFRRPGQAGVRARLLRRVRRGVVRARADVPAVSRERGGRGRGREAVRRRRDGHDRERVLVRRAIVHRSVERIRDKVLKPMYG
jgi:hypothetical protein